MAKFFIKTYGCQMNINDSERIADILLDAGFLKVNFPEEADFIILNTCSVREKASHKLFSDLGRLKPFKKSNPKLIVAVGGCVGKEEGKNIIAKSDVVDIVFGPNTFHRMVEFYQKATTENKKIVCSDTENSLEKYQREVHCHEKKITAFVTVMEGCNKFCSYCIVPFTRGRERSRNFVDLLKEVHQLVDSGVREINFLGQNVTDYCDGNYDLADLITEASQIDNLRRILFTTSYPSHFSEKLLNLYKTNPKLYSYLHLPVQSGSNRILQQMRRQYTREEYLELIAKIKNAREKISISSDFIVGFPNETEDDFLQTLDLVQKVGFDKSFSFIYSKRKGTLAEKMPDVVSLDEKKKRLERLQTALNLSAAKKQGEMVGKVDSVLVTGFAERENQLTGRTSNYHIINFVGDPTLIGKEVKVKITKILTNCLVGELCENLV